MDSAVYSCSALVLVAVVVPILLYCFRLKPEIGREHFPEIALGVLTAAFMFIPVGVVLPLHLGGFIICLIAAGVLMIVHWVVWLMAAIRKKPAGKLTRLSPVLPLLLWTNCAMGAIAWFFIIGYGICVIGQTKEVE